MARIDRVCLLCEQLFQIPSSHAHKPQYGKYCGNSCRLQARLRGLTAGGTGRQIYVWEAWMDELMRQYYDSRPENIDWLVTQIRFPRHILLARAQRLGVAQQRHKGPWTEADLAVLHAHLARMPLHQLAKRLGRTIGAIRTKAIRLGITKSHSDGYTARQLADLLGWTHTTVGRCIARGWLHASRRHMGYADKRPDAYYISEQAVYQFLIEHPEMIPWQRVEKDWLLDVLTRGAVTKARLRQAVS